MPAESRKDELLEQVVDHVLTHGLIGLTLRPLAADIGTSDRMLIYHFGSRDDLVSAVVEDVSQRSIAHLQQLPSARSVRSAVNRLWTEYQRAPMLQLLDVYVQAAATGLIGREPYRSATRAGNARWKEALADYMVRSGAPRRRVGRIVTLVDSSLFGFQLDLTTDQPAELARGVDDLARAAQTLATA